MYTFFIVLHIGVSILLVGAVLVQSGRGAATANIFGGARAAENVFGAATPAILNKVTAVLATTFIITSIVLTFFSSQLQRPAIMRELEREGVSAPAVDEFPAPLDASPPLEE